VIQLCLSDEQTVERIAVVKRKTLDCRGVRPVDRQDLQTVLDLINEAR
jgi:hypothetical protein